MTSFDWVAGLYDRAVFTAFDTETTGIDTENHRIVEIGAVRFDKYGVIARYNVLINPTIPMPEEASRINNITDDMLADKPVMELVMPDFLSFIKNSILIAHNAKFDIDHLNHELSLLGRTALTHKIIDTLIFAREVFPGLPSYALQNLAKQFGIAALQAHRAEDDARVCMDFFLQAVDRLIKREPSLVDRMRESIDTDEYLITADPKVDEQRLVQDLF